MTLKKQSVDGVTFAAVSHIGVSLLTLTQLLVLARLLTPSDFGLMGMLNLILGLGSLFGDIGISSFIIHRQEESPKVCSSLFWLSLISACGLCALIWAAHPWIERFYGEPRLQGLILYGAPLLMVIASGQTYQALLEKDLKFGFLAKLEVVATAIGVLSAVLLALRSWGPYALLGGAYANAATKTAGLVLCGHKHWRPRFVFFWPAVKEAFGFGIRLLGQRGANYVTANVDFLLIGSFLGARALGFYTLAYNIANLPSSKINAIVSRVLFPAFSKIQDDGIRLKRGFLRMQELTSMINFPILVGILIVAHLAIPTLLGASWDPAIPLLRILSVVGLGRAVAGTVGPLLLARGRTDLGLKWSLLIATIQVPGILAGVLWGGVRGVAFSFAVLQTIYSILNYPLLIRNLIGPCLREYISTLWSACWMSLCMAGFCWALMTTLSGMPDRLLLIVTVVSGSAVYLTLAWVLKRSRFSDLTQLILARRIT